MTVLEMVTVVCIGLMIGTEFAVSAFINPVLWRLEGGAQMEAVRLFATKLGFVMPFWYALGLILLLAQTFVVRHQAALVPAAVASGIWMVVIALTLMYLVPINNKFVRRETADLTTAERDHRKWDGMHRWRVAALTAAMVLFLMSVK